MTDTAPTPCIKLALSVAEAAESLSISERSVWSMIYRGELPHVRLGDKGGRVLLPVRELADFLTRKAAEAAAGLAGCPTNDADAPDSPVDRPNDSTAGVEPQK